MISSYITLCKSKLSPSVFFIFFHLLQPTHNLVPWILPAKHLLIPSFSPSLSLITVPKPPSISHLDYESSFPTRFCLHSGCSSNLFHNTIRMIFLRCKFDHVSHTHTFTYLAPFSGLVLLIGLKKKKFSGLPWWSTG